MASPPNSQANSPPGPSSLALPRQRLTLALPGQAKARKPSIASSTSSHPLRQTSFPPPDRLERHYAASPNEASGALYSPSQDSLEDVSDSEIKSAISGPTATGIGAAGGGGGDEGAPRKRKRGEKRARGRPPKNPGLRAGSLSVINGEDARSTKRGGAAGSTTGAGAGEEQDEDEADEGNDEEVTAKGRQPLYEGGQMSAADLEAEGEQKAIFYSYLSKVDSAPLRAERGVTVSDHTERYNAWIRGKLRLPDVRKIVNQTLSQSVPAGVVTVVSAYSKMFAGLLIEEARKVQAEWEAVEENRADGEENLPYKRLKLSHAEEDNGEANAMTEKAAVPDEEHQPSSSSDPAPGASTQDSNTQINDINSVPAEPVGPGGAGGLISSISECDRGPLLPDHLREALRRYKKSRKGGTVGFTGLSLQGRETAAPRMGGRRLFR